MIKNLSRDPSLRTFENEETSIYGSNPPKIIHNFFALTNKRSEKYSQKSFQCFYTAKGERTQNNQNTLNRVNSSSNFNENRSLNRKPLNELLKSNKQLSLHGMSRSQKDKILYKTCKTETKIKQIKDKNSNCNKINEKIHQKNVSNFNVFEDYQSAVEKNLSFIKLRQNVQYVKNLQSEMQKSISRSRSSKRKGLQCTLYQKSLQKKINQSEIRSNKKLVTVKKRFQKTQNEQGLDNQAPKKDIKKVLLKRKNKDNQKNNQAGCFSSIIINQNHLKKVDLQNNKINLNSGYLPKVQQNIRSVSKSKITEFNKLNRSMSLIKQTCRNHNFDSANKQSVQKKRRNSQSRKRNTVSKSKNQLFNQSSITKGKKVTINEKVQQNLNKVHQKYKFILNYLTDFDIIGKLNGYELAGKQECKWILLLIDQVYEMIKHSAETKLKGIEYSRNYYYTSLKTE